MAGEPSTTCPRCGKTSYHPMDIKERYCAACHLFYDQMATPGVLTWWLEVRTNREPPPFLVSGGVRFECTQHTGTMEPGGMVFRARYEAVAASSQEVAW